MKLRTQYIRERKIKPKPTSGFNPEILNELMTEKKLDSIQSFKKMSHYTLMKCGFNQVQFIVNLQTDQSDLLKWEALMISFRNFNTGWKVEIQVTTQRGSFPAMS